MANLTFKANLLPNANATYSLGSSTQQWAFYGTATNAIYAASSNCASHAIHSGSATYSTSAAQATHSASAAYASSAGNADTVDSLHAESFAKIASHNNLTASGNEFTFASTSFNGAIWINYRTAGGTNGNITQYNFGNGKGGSLASITSGTFNGNCTGNAATATKLSNTPNNTTTFLRGDNTWSNTLTGSLTVQNRIYCTNWVQMTDNSGLYFPNSGSGTHFYPANDVTYGSYQMQGAKNGYCGITMGASNDRLTIMDNGNDKGLYQTTGGMWLLYYNKSNSRLGLRTSSLSGYPVTCNGSLYVNDWIRAGGATGFYFESYGGGWHMEDNTWLRSYGNKNIYMGTGLIRTDLVSGGSWIQGSHDGAFQVRAATTAGAGAFFQSWFSGFTPGGSWGIGCLAGYDNMYFSFGSHANYNSNINSTANIVFGAGGQVYGAVWNDYAEYRNVPEAQKNCSKANAEQTSNELAGRCVCEVGDDTMVLSSSRLQKGCKIISDTFGFAIGETDECKTPIAVSGRVLVFPYENKNEFRNHIGDAVCSGPNGTVSIMTDEEVKKYPLSIIGTISAIPEYKEWGTNHILVNGRIWIYVK